MLYLHGKRTEYWRKHLQELSPTSTSAIRSRINQYIISQTTEMQLINKRHPKNLPSHLNLPIDRSCPLRIDTFYKP